MLTAMHGVLRETPRMGAAEGLFQGDGVLSGWRGKMGKGTINLQNIVNDCYNPLNSDFSFYFIR